MHVEIPSGATVNFSAASGEQYSVTSSAVAVQKSPVITGPELASRDSWGSALWRSKTLFVTCIVVLAFCLGTEFGGFLDTLKSLGVQAQQEHQIVAAMRGELPPSGPKPTQQPTNPFGLKP